MGEIIYLTGAVRSGKSRRAVEIAAAWGETVVFVATYRTDGDDEEMAERVRLHQAHRPAWRTLEAPRDVKAALGQLNPPPAGVVVDCLTLWLSDRLAWDDEKIFAEWTAQLAAFRAATWPVVVVGNEIGWGLVPPDAALRRFRDLAGSLGQQTAAMASEAWLMVAGCAVRIK
jgi:adenosylcobinamide kinase / adenosylcobinamide-phosphate guanylyltransferase